MYVLSTTLTCIGITALSYFELLPTPPTYTASAFQNFFRIENQLNIKKVMSKEVYDHFELLSTPSTYIVLQPL